MKALFAAIGRLLVEIADFITTDGRRFVRRILGHLETALRIAAIWPFALLAITLCLTPRWAQNIMPIFTLIPVAVALWIVTDRRHLGSTILIEALPGKAGKDAWAITKLADKIVKKLKKAINLVVLALGTEVAIGIYLSIVPIMKDRWLTPLLIAIVAAGVLFILSGKKSVANLAWVGVAVITIIFFLGGRDNVHAQIEKITKTAFAGTAAEGFNPDPEVICPDRTPFMQGGRLYIPLHKGCWTKFDVPDVWASWGSEDADDNPPETNWVSFWYKNWDRPSNPKPLNVDHGQWETAHNGNKAQGHGMLILHRIRSN